MSKLYPLHVCNWLAEYDWRKTQNRADCFYFTSVITKLNSYNVTPKFTDILLFNYHSLLSHLNLENILPFLNSQLITLLLFSMKQQKWLKEKSFNLFFNWTIIALQNLLFSVKPQHEWFMLKKNSWFPIAVPTYLLVFCLHNSSLSISYLLHLFSSVQKYCSRNALFPHMWHQVLSSFPWGPKLGILSL